MNPQDAWSAAYHQLELQLDRPSFDTWLRGASLLSVDNDVYVIGVRNNYVRDMLQHRLYRNIRRVLGDVLGSPVELRFEVPKAALRPEAAEPESDMPLFRLLAQQDASAPKLPLHQQIARPQRPDLPESELNPRYIFDRLIVGSENEMVFSAARAVVENSGASYNPFLVYGGVGLGKTHLLQAIGHACQARNMRVLYISSEAFTNDLIDAIRHRTTAMFREKYRMVDVLLMDDIQFIGGKESTQEEFFHTFNALHMFNRQIVLASDRHPSELQDVVDRLKSRFQGGLTMKIEPPEIETRLAILDLWAQERQVSLEKDVRTMLADRARSSIRELQSLFTQVVATMQLKRESVNVHQAHSILEHHRRPRYHVSLTKVLDLTASYHGVTVEDLVGPRRSGPLNQARQVAMFLAREITDASLPQIGAAFGGRAHSTVLHSCNKVAEALETDAELRQAVIKLRESLIKSGQ